MRLKPLRVIRTDDWSPTSPRARDIADAQDALSEALVAALENWPTNGVPDKPEAWLLHVARNRLIDASRREQTRRDAEPLLQQLAEEAESLAKENEFFPDERLKLLFVSAHPAIDVAARTPLMLQVVLGIDAAKIGSALLVSPRCHESETSAGQDENSRCGDSVSRP
jgi:RNA polymerase sigma-70 factor, ECF subfamily